MEKIIVPHVTEFPSTPMMCRNCDWSGLLGEVYEANYSIVLVCPKCKADAVAHDYSRPVTEEEARRPIK